jgi:hypothetical protein
MFKSVCVLSALALLGACSHHQPKKVSKPYQVSKSFLDVIKTKKPGKPEADKRFPASAKPIPGLPEFMVALKANPSFLKAPVGYEIVKENTGVYESKPFKTVEKSVYLKENLDGHFVLETYDGTEDVMFALYESQRIEGLEQELVSQETIKSFKKISATNFIMIFDFPEVSGLKGTCQMALDLTKSSELQDNLCKDSAGVIVSETKIISAKSIKLEDYASALKSIKLEVYPNALKCGMITVEGEEESPCFNSVKDGEEKNWSYILK